MYLFNGHELHIHQHHGVQPQARCPTGGFVWPSSCALLRLLEGLHQRGYFPPSASFIDLSAGCGLVSLALSHIGNVYSTEIYETLPLLQKNCGTRSSKIACLGYLWGSQLPEEIPEKVTLAVASDLLYIAVRDGLEAELASTLSALALRAELGVLISFEPRKEEGESRVLAEVLKLGGGQLSLTEIHLDGSGLGGKGVGDPGSDIFLPPSLVGEDELDVKCFLLSKGVLGTQTFLREIGHCLNSVSYLE